MQQQRQPSHNTEEPDERGEKRRRREAFDITSAERPLRHDAGQAVRQRKCGDYSSEACDQEQHPDNHTHGSLLEALQSSLIEPGGARGNCWTSPYGEHLSLTSACYGRSMPRPNPRDYFNNFSNSDLPLLEKLRLVAKNNAIKIKNGTSCCGNHGEPGC